MKLPHLVRSLGVYTLLGFAPLAVNFFLLPLYTTKLDPSEFGILTAVNIGYSFSSLFIGLGIEAGYARLFFDHIKTPRRLHRLLASALFGVMATALLLALVFLVAGKQLFAALWHEVPFSRYGALTVWGAFIQVLFSILYLHYRNAEDLARVAALSLLASVASVIGAVLAVLLWRADALAAFAGRIAGLSLVTLVGLVAVLGQMTSYRPELKLLRGILAFGVPVLAYSLVAYVLFNGDRILMERWFTLRDLGLYALASVVVSPLEIALQAGQQAVHPSFYRWLDEKDPNAEDLINGFYNACVLVAVIVSVLIILCSEPVLLVFRGTQYVASVRYLPLLCLAQMLRVLWTGYAFFIFYSKKTTVLPVVTGLAILAGLGGAMLTHRVLGDLSIAMGVLSWKVAQLLMTAAAVRTVSPERKPSYRPVYGILAAMTVYVVALYKAAPAYHKAVAFGGGLVLVAVAGVQLVGNLRSGWLTETGAAAKAPPHTVEQA